MLGKNKIRPQELGDGQKLWIQEIYYTIQGEGPLAGIPAVFIRLAGCNLRCFWCDTDFESSTWHPTLEEMVEKVVGMCKGRTTVAVLTGGEPFRQNFLPLIDHLNREGIAVQIETAGTLFIPKLEARFSPRGIGNSVNTIICSPKTSKLDRRLAPYIHGFKYVTRVGETSDIDGLPLKSSQNEGKADKIARPMDYNQPAISRVVVVRNGDEEKPLRWRPIIASEIYIQPCDEGDAAKTIANCLHAAEICLKHGYRLSLQIHKMVDLP